MEKDIKEIYRYFISQGTYSDEFRISCRKEIIQCTETGKTYREKDSNGNLRIFKKEEVDTFIPLVYNGVLAYSSYYYLTENGDEEMVKEIIKNFIYETNKKRIDYLEKELKKAKIYEEEIIKQKI